MDELKFKVYAHINKLNNKVYIGITSQNPEKRWMKGNGYIPCTAFYRAIKKYGWNNFENIILYEGLDNKEALNIETKLILEYKNKGLSYNIKTDPTWIGKSRQHTLYVYNIKGMFIQKCESIHRASIIFNISESGIYYCATKYRNTLSWKGYIFLFQEESIEERLELINTFKRHPSVNKRKIEMLSLTGKVLKEFNSLTEAGKYIKSTSIGNITSCCKGLKKSFKGFRWRYKI